MMQQTVEKERYSSEVSHLKERLDESNRIHSEKGELNRGMIDKKMD